MYRFSVWLFIFEKKRHILLHLFLSPSWGYKLRKGRDEAPTPCCFNKACPSKIFFLPRGDISWGKEETRHPSQVVSIKLVHQKSLEARKPEFEPRKPQIVQHFNETGRKKKTENTSRSPRFQQVKHARFACNSTSYTNILHLTLWSALVHCRHEVLLLCCGVWFVRFYLYDSMCAFAFIKKPTVGYLRREPGESWSRCSGSSEGSGYKASGMMMLTCIIGYNT